MLPTEAATALFVFVLAYVYHKFIKYRDLCRKAARSFALIEDRHLRLDRWQKARPFLHRGYCSYAPHLINEMIVAQKFLLDHGFSKDYERFVNLCALLDEYPPEYDPPLAGGSLFV